MKKIRPLFGRTDFGKLQPSLRDSSHSEKNPGVKTPGYCRMSLRDFCKETGLRRLKALRAELFEGFGFLVVAFEADFSKEF